MASETIFLTTEQALEAICIDFRSYRPQPMVFSELLRELTGNEAACQREPGREGLWIAEKRPGPMRWLEGEELVTHMCRTLRQAGPTPDQLAAICRRVFQIQCRPAPNTQNGRLGIRIRTDMKGFVCRRCGRCCRSLAYRDSLTEEDVARLITAGRKDVLDWVGVTRDLNAREHYRVWMTPGTNQFAPACPFLKPGSSNHHQVCAIHEVKPDFCRHYPLSRKHAFMTGCPGFDA